MCGIAGIVGALDGPEAVERVRAMVSRLERRGPDDEGLESWPGATLGHRRLAIYDLSQAGHQPMLSANGSVGVVFNGAIYNWPTLQEDLTAKGWAFESSTDTEVLLHGYQEWGIDGLVARCRGMFAFGLWDQRIGKLFLVRDRLGVKPLAYIQENGVIAFASTPIALEAGDFGRSISEQAVAEFLEFGFVPERSCIFAGMKKLPPATILEWSNGRSSIRRYWSLEGRPTRSVRDYEDIVEEAEVRFLDAVSIRQYADVQVAALLSGGVDSALVCWALAELGANVAAYTVGTPGHKGDETASAVATAQTLGLDHTVIPLDSSVSPGLQDLVSAYPEPFACASAMGMLAVAKAIKSHASVVLTGDGGDDAFLGYRRHKYLWMAERVAGGVPSALLAGWREVAARVPRSNVTRKAAQFMDVVAGGLGAYLSAESGIAGLEADGVLGERLAGVVIPERELPQSTDAARSVLSRFLEYHRQEKLVAEYLTKVDGATMHHGLEARSPFMDQHIWEFTAKLPANMLLHDGELKSVLRTIAQRRLGDRVASGSKRGFTIPVESWLGGRWRRQMEESLRDSVLERDGFIQAGVLRTALEARPPGEPLPKIFWYYLVLETWMRLREANGIRA